MAKRMYTKEEFIDAYNTSTTKSELLIKLNLSPKSSKVVDKRCKEYNLDVAKFTSQTNYTISDRDFEEAVKKSTSKRQVLLLLGLAPQGGNYSSFDKRVKALGLDTSHFLGQASNKSKNFGPKRPIEDYLSNKYTIQSCKLKNRLLQEGIFEPKCYKCSSIKWNDKPIPLELEHIDGNHKNNSLENLTLLCPNCHAQTDTYRGKNIKNKSGG